MATNGGTGRDAVQVNSERQPDVASADVTSGGVDRPLREAHPKQKLRQKFQRSWRQDVSGKKMRNGASESPGKAGMFGDSLVVEGPWVGGGIGVRS